MIMVKDRTAAHNALLTVYMMNKAIIRFELRDIHERFLLLARKKVNY
jgi:hypothetical protein